MAALTPGDPVVVTTWGSAPAHARPFSVEPMPFDSTREHGAQEGMTKREVFAAMALQGLLADSDRDSVEACAKKAVRAADALIAALNAPQPVAPQSGGYCDDRR